MGLAAPIVSGLTAYRGYRESRDASKQAEQQNEQQRGLIDLQTGQAKELSQYGRPYMAAASRAFNPVLNFYLRAAGGDRSSLGKLMAPEVGQLNQGYDAAQRGQAAVAPRTGATAETSAQLPMQRLAAIYKLFGGARMGAMNALTGLGSGLASMGSGLMGASLGGLQGASSGMGNLSQLMLQQRQRSQEEGEGIGEGLSGAIGGFNEWWKNRG